MSIEDIKKFHDDFIKFFQTRDKHEMNLLACQILLSATTDPELKKFNEDDTHTNYFNEDKQYVDEFLELLFGKFKNLMIDNFPEMQKFVNDTIEMCKQVFPGHLLILFRELCELNNKNNNLNSILFDEFYSYTTKTKQRNSEWTSETICKIFALLAKDYKIETLLDPCIGANKLVNNLCRIRKINPVVYGFDVVPVLSIMTFLDLIKLDIDNGINISEAGLKHHIKCQDLFTIDNLNLKCSYNLIDLCVCNPPYTKKTSGHDALEFIVKSMSLSKHGIYIFPCNQIRGNIALESQKQLLKIATIDRIITLGSQVFNGIGAGDVCIMVCTNRKILDKQSKTIVQNIQYHDYIDRIPHSNQDKYKPEREKELIKMIIKHEHSQIIDTENNFDWCGKINLFNLVRQQKIIYNGKLDDISILKYFTENSIRDKFKNSCFELIFENIKNKFIELEQTIKFLQNISENKFKKVKLLDIFKKLTGKSIRATTDAQKLSEQILTYQNNNFENHYPIIGASKMNDGIINFMNEFTFEASKINPLYTIAKNGTVGILFKHEYNFNITSDVYVLEPLIKLHDININILTTQLTNMGFSFGNKINIDKLKDIEIYVYIEN